MTVAGVLLAAGGGHRFGGPKALVRFDGQLLVERGVRLLAAGGCDPVVVVLGAACDEVVRTASLGDAIVVVNTDWPTGMGSSLRAGFGALPAPVPAAVIALVDQPLVSPTAVRRLADAWRAGARAAVATYDGEQRNPVALDRSTWPDVIAAAVGDTGARGYLRAHPELVTAVACDDVASSYDIDTAADLAEIAGTLAPEETSCS